MKINSTMRESSYRTSSSSSTTTMVKARRAHSMPAYYGHFVLPAHDMGEYDEVDGGVARRRSAPAHPAKGSMLYPLTEEGTYGAPPNGPAPPRDDGYVRRERKPKVYSSYSVNKDCELHGKDKLARSERDHGEGTFERRRRISSVSSSSHGSVPSRRPSWAPPPSQVRLIESQKFPRSNLNGLFF